MKTDTTTGMPDYLLGRLFYRWAELCYDHARLILVLCLLLVAGLVSQIPKIPVDMSTEAMLHKKDPVRLNYNTFKQLFGREDVIVLSLPTGGELNDELLAKIGKLQDELETRVPHVAKVTSVINTRHTYGDDDELIVEDLLDGWPDHKWESRELTEFVVSQPSYRDRLISADGQYTALLIRLNAFADQAQTEFLDQVQSADAVKVIRQVVNGYPELEIAMAGKPVILNILNIMTLRDSTMTGTASLVMTVLFMIIFFRRASGVFLPLLVICGSMFGAGGIMGIFGTPFTLTIGTVFPLMVAVGVADSVHILSHFYRNYEHSGNKRQAVVDAIAYSAPAVLMTSLTTAAGFMSFVAGDLAATAELGIYAAIAVLFALYFTVALLPALIALFNIRRHAGNKGVNHHLEGFLQGCGNLACRFPRLISVLALGAMALCFWGCSFLYFSYDPISRFPDSIVEKKDNYKVDEVYRGNTTIEILIDTGVAGGIYSKPQFIPALKQAAAELSETTITGLPMADSYSLLNIIRETHKALNGNRDEYYKVPEDSRLIAQEVLLFEMNNSDDLRDVVDSEYRTVRLTLKTVHEDGVKYETLIRELEQRVPPMFDGMARVTITGSSVLGAESVPKALATMAKSYVVAALLIIGMMMLMVRSLRIGLVSIVPNLLPILLVMNVMVIMGWPLDMTTILVGAIAMGVVVDDTLHFLYHFKLSYQKCLNARYAVRNTLRTTGPALFITTIIFSTGAGGNMISSIENIFVFGVTMWLVTILALLADILVAPALLIWIYGDHKHDDDWLEKEEKPQI